MSIANTNPHSFPASSVIDAPLTCRIVALEQRIAELEARVAELEKGNFPLNAMAWNSPTVGSVLAAVTAEPLEISSNPASLIGFSRKTD